MAGIATGFFFFISLAPFNTAILSYSTMSLTNKLILCLFPNTNMAFGSYIIIMKESKGVGLTWDNVNLPAVPNDNLTVIMIMCMSLFNMVLYMMITWYVTLAFPGEYGIPIPWYFPFTKKYWFPSAENTGVRSYLLNNDELDHHHQIDSSNLEANPRNLKAGICIQNLTKSYGNIKGKPLALDNLTMNMYEGQITALLGHNGAGKTTTISILIGLFPPTSGSATLNGLDIRDQIDEIRSSLGICPQFNILFDELTVEEHLQFYCKLKHTPLTNNQIEEEVTNMIVKLDLADKRKSQAHELSGGMKRKLSVSSSVQCHPVFSFLFYKGWNGFNRWIQNSDFG